MGNLFAECRRCSIEQCELCQEALPRRHRTQNQSTGNSGSVLATNPVDNDSPPNAAFIPDHLQPTNLSEADAIRLAQHRSLQDPQQRMAQLSPRVSEDMNGAGGFARLVDEDADTALLHAAIMATHQTGSVGPREPRPPTEEELRAQAIRAAQLEEDQLNRARLREEQRQEYEESLRLDRQKQEERQEREREEEEKQRVAEQARHQAEEEERIRRDNIGKLVAEARARLKDEPGKEDKGRVMVKVGTPQGRPLKRAFRSTDPVSQVYDFVVAEGGEELASTRFRLLQNVPRCVFEDRDATLQVAGLRGQCALLVQIIESDDECDQAEPPAKAEETRAPESGTPVVQTETHLPIQEPVQTPAHVRQEVGLETAQQTLRTPSPATGESAEQAAVEQTVAPPEMAVSAQPPEVTPAEAPDHERAPAQQEPAQQASAQQVPAHQESAQQAPVQQAPVQEQAPQIPVTEPVETADQARALRVTAAHQAQQRNGHRNGVQQVLEQITEPVKVSEQVSPEPSKVPEQVPAFEPENAPAALSATGQTDHQGQAAVQSLPQSVA